MNNPRPFNPVPTRFARRGKPRIALGIIAVVLIQQLVGVVSPAIAVAPDHLALFEMAESGHGATALQAVAGEAMLIGGWAPAPGDVLVYEADMPTWQRGGSRVIDQPPVECASHKPSMRPRDCNNDYGIQQNEVRFGPSMFSNPQPDGSRVARPALDDLLSTYIEEVGHSWQEYLFETEGRGSGPRTRMTGWEDGMLWAHGTEYQIKRYILSLDGSVLNLSAPERATLLRHICESDGYASPLGYRVPSYGAPAGWPNPDGWPVTGPTPEALQAFCAAS